MMRTLAILGPTAVGKSALAGHLAERLDGEIVSIDSRQIYRHTDIGTAKPPRATRARIPHHLIDVLDLHERIDAERFARMAETAIGEIDGRGRLPILAGGSGLYFRALFHGLFVIDLDRAQRAAFARSIEEVPVVELFRRLENVDPESARRIHPNDRYRIARALEVHALSGTPLSEHFRRQRGGTETAKRGARYRKAGLRLPRGMLYERINERTRGMMTEGWLDEVKELLASGADPSWPGLQSLGYPEMVAVAGGEITEEEAIERISRLTRRYAKRQMTWFRKVEGVTWFEAERAGLSKRMLDWFRSGE
jgi:tRNA dimethylallyltransferase